MGSDQIKITTYETNEKENIVSNEKTINEKENINSNEKKIKEKESRDLSEEPTNEDTSLNESNRSEDANLNESNINEVKQEPLKKDLYSNFLSNYLPKYSFCYDELELRPEYKTEKYSYFFSIGKLVDYLNTELNQALKDYNILLQPYDLIDFSQKEQKEKYNKKIGVWPTLKRDIALLAHPEQNSKEMKKKAKCIAYFLSQFNTENKKHNENNPYYIAYFDFSDGKFHFENDPFFGEVNSRLSLEIDNNNYDDYIKSLYEVFISLENSISLTNQDKNRKEIFMNYLIRSIDKKIKLIEHSLIKPESETNLKSIRSKINELAIKYCYYQQSDVKFFYDLTFDSLYIIKDQPNEKEALVVKGVNLDSFKNTFEEEFSKLNGFAISNEDEAQEIDNDFIKKCDKNIKYYEGKSTEGEDKINKIKKDTFKESLDNAKSIVGAINNSGEENNKKSIVNDIIEKGGDVIMNIADIHTARNTINRVKLSEEKRQQQLIYWKKLKNIKSLLNKIESILKENIEFKAIIISQKIDKNNDSFITKVIY